MAHMECRGFEATASSTGLVRRWRRRAGSGVHRLGAAVRVTLRVGKLLAFSAFHRADYARWADTGNLQAWWDSRTERLARLVPPGGRVIEFGAGRRRLETYLAQGSAYIPSDLVDRGPGTIVCDLNLRPLPDLSDVKPDVAVFGGVCEYIRDLPGLVGWLSTQVSSCVTSYACVRTPATSLSGLAERFERIHYGYMNHYSEEALVALFARSGFTCESRDTWDSQKLFRFSRSRQARPA